jgi:small ubiquitin-related modifier
MGKVFRTYAAKKGLQVDTIRFLYDGERIDKGSTPETVGLEDQDQIDCVLRHVGGIGTGSCGTCSTFFPLVMRL